MYTNTFKVPHRAIFHWMVIIIRLWLNRFKYMTIFTKVKEPKIYLGSRQLCRLISSLKNKNSWSMLFRSSSIIYFLGWAILLMKKTCWPELLAVGNKTNFQKRASLYLLLFPLPAFLFNPFLRLIQARKFILIVFIYSKYSGRE